MERDSKVIVLGDDILQRVMETEENLVEVHVVQPELYSSDYMVGVLNILCEVKALTNKRIAVSTDKYATLFNMLAIKNGLEVRA